MNIIRHCFTTRYGRPIVLPLVTLLAFTPNLLKADGPDGESIYTQNCAACHKPDGAGVQGAYPALMGSPVVAGDADTVINVVVQGPAKVLPADRPKYTGQMPPFAGLSDAKIAALVTYIRNNFGKGATAVSEDQVTKVKASLPH
jgi:mono/diheme cytochrome c family protein